MTEEMRDDLTPQGYIRQLFRETVDGKLAITYYPFIGEPETRTYEVNWTAEDAEQIVSRYILLTNALTRIGYLHDQLEDAENRNKLLTAADLEVWNTYVQPYEPMEVNWDELYPIPPCEPDALMSLIQEIHERGQYGDLIEEEEMLWKQYCMWNEEQSQKRIPFNRRSSANMILAAKRYEGAIRLSAPEIVVTDQGRSLAEEMVLYYAGREEPIVWD
jgi:hypothetical protein